MRRLDRGDITELIRIRHEPGYKRRAFRCTVYRQWVIARLHSGSTAHNVAVINRGITWQVAVGTASKT